MGHWQCSHHLTPHLTGHHDQMVNSLHRCLVGDGGSDGDNGNDDDGAGDGTGDPRSSLSADSTTSLVISSVCSLRVVELWSS